MVRTDTLLAMYRAMLAALGPSNWWPAESSFEVALGAILTQNTNWSNVTKAINNLKASNALAPGVLREMPLEELAELIRPSGYFRMKAQKVKNFLDFLYKKVDGKIDDLRACDWSELRSALLQVKGIGPETADSILCYALHHPVFVVDAYTARISSRHGLVPEEVSYGELQSFFMDRLEADTSLFNEFHALLVRVGHTWCRKGTPLCTHCPLQPFLDA